MTKHNLRLAEPRERDGKVVRLQKRMTAAELLRLKPEEDIQREVAAYLDRFLPKDWRWFHAPNGGHRLASVAAKLKAAGVKRGVADVIICRPDACDIWIELKSFAGVLSPEQRKWREWMQAAGRPYFVARSVADVQEALKQFLPERKAA